MNNFVINKYLIIEFLKAFLNIVLIFCCLGLILNLFEEINYFKNYDIGILMPLGLSLMIIPSILINLLPFILFLSSMWVFIKLKNIGKAHLSGTGSSVFISFKKKEIAEEVKKEFSNCILVKSLERSPLMQIIE